MARGFVAMILSLDLFVEVNRFEHVAHTRAERRTVRAGALRSG